MLQDLQFTSALILMPVSNALIYTFQFIKVNIKQLHGLKHFREVLGDEFFPAEHCGFLSSIIRYEVTDTTFIVDDLLFLLV